MMRSIRPLSASAALVLMSASNDGGGAERSESAAADKAAADKAGKMTAIVLLTSSIYGPNGRQIVRNTVVRARRSRADGLCEKSKARLATKKEIDAAGDLIVID